MNAGELGMDGEVDEEEDSESEEEESSESVAGWRSRRSVVVVVVGGLCGWCSMWHRGGGNADWSSGGSREAWRCRRRGQEAYEARVARRAPQRVGNDSSVMSRLLRPVATTRTRARARGGGLGAGGWGGWAAGRDGLDGGEKREEADGREDGLSEAGMVGSTAKEYRVCGR